MFLKKKKIGLEAILKFGQTESYKRNTSSVENCLFSPFKSLLKRLIPI